jgi:hypothetical protein
MKSITYRGETKKETKEEVKAAAAAKQPVLKRMIKALGNELPHLV